MKVLRYDGSRTANDLKVSPILLLPIDDCHKAVGALLQASNLVVAVLARIDARDLDILFLRILENDADRFCGLVYSDQSLKGKLRSLCKRRSSGQ